MGSVARASPPRHSSAGFHVAASPAVRRYYLTTSTYTGGEAASEGVCAAGYHFASLWEILDPSNLRYDADLGKGSADSGHGPPTYVSPGWVRTGYPASVVADAGKANCDVWSSSNAGDRGTFVTLPSDWADPAAGLHVWEAGSAECRTALFVWCVSDPLLEDVYLPLVTRG
jgi:hypothetical protein